MQFFSRLKAAANILTGKDQLFSKVIETSLPNGVLDFMQRFGKVPDVSQDALVRKYFGFTYACANVSATRLASTPLRLYASRGVGQQGVKNFRVRPVTKEQKQWIKSRVGKSLEHVAGAEDFEELEEHPLLDLLQNVNDQENSFEMKELTSIMLDLTGNAYWMIERDKMGVPSKFFCLRSQWVRIIPDKETFVKGYWYGYNNAFGVDTRLEIEPDNVIHFKYPNPLDPWYGMGPVQAAAYTIENDELRSKFMLATMQNMGRPDMVVKYLEGELDPQERQNLEREWNAQFRGAKNAGKIKVTDFRYELDKIGWSPSELDFTKGEDWILKKICSVFPVPVGLVDSSQISRAPRSGMEGSDLFMAQFNTLPRCTRIEEKLNEKLCPMYDERLFLAFDNPVARDRVAQNAEDSSRLANGYTTINELRKRDGEDSVEWGDLPLIAAGMAPLGSATPNPDEQGNGNFFPAQGAGTSERLSGGASSEGKKPKEGEVIDAGDNGKKKPAEGEVIDGKSLAKALGDNVEMELDGKHVHETLAGIPVKLRVRNEGGRFDRHSPDKLRASRDVMNTLKLKP